MKRPIRGYRGALFDLDGTLADSMPLWDRLCRNWLAAQGKTPGEDLEADIAKLSLNAGAEYVIRRYGFDCSPQEMIAQWETLVLERYTATVPLKEEPAALVRELHAAGVKLAVVTSCFPAACEGFLGRHNLRPLFSAVLYTDESPEDKSSPAIWLAAARRLGLESSDCIVFEDAYHAQQGARAAGMGFAAVYDGACKDWELMKAQADWIIGGAGNSTAARAGGLPRKERRKPRIPTAAPASG
ncbi:MAG: HAD family phosphatase [Treponema sp.]|jgi:HAD superfamily hydrolase (TIGR01509 family)|nr:HAD family phosphatase [Treponema sp.]